MKGFNSQSRKKVMKWSLILLIISIAIIIFELRDFLPIYSYQDLSNTEFSDIKEGPAQVEVTYIWDWFCATDDESTREYLIPVKDVFIACEIRGKANKEVYRNLDILLDLETADPDITIEEINEIIEPVVIKGRLENLTEGDDYEYYNDYMNELKSFGYDDSDDYLSEIFKPVILRQRQVGGRCPFGIKAFVLAIMIAMICLLLVINTLVKDPLKEIKNYCKSTGDYEGTLQKFERLYHLDNGSKIKADNEYILFLGTNNMEFCKTQDVIWFYGGETGKGVTYVNGESLQIKVFLASGKIHQIEVSVDEAQRAICDLKYYAPAAFEGYSDELFTRFMRDRQSMINEVNSRKFGITY